MLGIDLVLPGLRLPARARRRHRGDRRHARPRGPPRRAAVGPARARPTARPPVYGGPLTIAMARSKLDEHRLKEVAARGRRARGRRSSSGPFDVELVHMTHSIPDALRGRARRPSSARCSSPATTSSTRRPVDGEPADVSRLAELGREGLLLLCGDSTNADRPGFSPSESSVGPAPRGGLRALRGPHRRHLLRVEHPPRPAGRRRRRRARPQGRAGRALDAQERRTSGATLGHIEVPEGMLVPAARDRGLPRRASS